MKILVTGASSSSAAHLTACLAKNPTVEIFGVSRDRRQSEQGCCRIDSVDLINEEQVTRLVERVDPAAVFHLAASSDEADPHCLIATNISGTWNLLTACRQNAVAKVLLIGSAASFGEMEPGESGLAASRPARPGSFYGFSRQAQLDLGRLAFEKWGMNVFMCRPFNLIGPGLSRRYAPAALARRMLAAKVHGDRTFPLLNASAVRDFVDFRDAVAAYQLIVEKGQPAVPYSVGRGIGVTMAELARQIAEIIDFEVEIISDSSAAGSDRSGIQRSVADISELTRDTGWVPVISLAESLRDMIATIDAG